MNLSKSRYTLGVTCGKKLWLSCYKPEEAVDTGNESVLDNGNKVGDLARGLFGDYVLIWYNENYAKMISDTEKVLANKPNIICEASFSYDGNFCSVDILKNDVDGVEIYEVKSSTGLKNIYLEDVSYQTWVLNKLGIKVKKSYVIHVNSDYVREEKFDINKYFVINDVTDKINLDVVENNVLVLKKIINNNSEPNIDLSTSCKDPYECPFFNYCTKDLVKPNIFDIGWRMGFKQKLDCYYNGIISFKDALTKAKLNDKARVQVESFLNDLEPVINEEKIKDFLNNLTYPIYFLDFESFQEAIPSIVGTRPYQQICFQYSLHYLDEYGDLFHEEYLSEDYNSDPMYGLCKSLCEAIPEDSCILVYNDSFEKGRLREMAMLYPEFKEHLMNIHDHIVDLLPIFRNQDYYIKEIGDGASIKQVLPALFPNDPKLDYHNLDDVHKGDEASNAYLSLKDLSEEEQEKLRYNMLKYCELDTYAMVKIYEKLKEIVKVKEKTR